MKCAAPRGCCCTYCRVAVEAQIVVVREIAVFPAGNDGPGPALSFMDLEEGIAYVKAFGCRFHESEQLVGWMVGKGGSFACTACTSKRHGSRRLFQVKEGSLRLLRLAHENTVQKLFGRQIMVT